MTISTRVARTRKAMVKALRDGKQLSRVELTAVLKQAGIEATGLRFLHIMMHAELEGLICSGARRGKEMTYMLLDERATWEGGLAVAT